MQRINLQRINLRRPSFLLPFLLVFLFLARADFAAEKTRFDLQQLKAPPGFHISVFAENIDGARMMVFSPGGVLLVSESGEGKVVALPDSKHAGKAERTVDVLSRLNEPHGLAFYEGKLYVAENDKVRRYDWDEANLRASNPVKPRRSADRRRTLHPQPLVSRRQDVCLGRIEL